MPNEIAIDTWTKWLPGDKNRGEEMDGQSHELEEEVFAGSRQLTVKRWTCLAPGYG